MGTDLTIVLALLAAAVAMFAANRPRMDVVGLLVMTALPLTGVIDVGEALSGFSDPNVVLIAALFVIGEGLVRTGVAQRLGDWLTERAGRSETRLLALMMTIVAGIGALMSSTAVVAIFIPVVLRIARNRGIAPGRLMMPLSFAGLISGMMTLIGTPPNLVVNAELARRGLPGFELFDFTPFGVTMLVLGIAYMLFARRWLTTASAVREAAHPRPRVADWIEEYGLAGRAHRLRVRPHSTLVGRTLQELALRRTAGVSVVAVERRRGRDYDVLRPTASTMIEPGDVLFLYSFAEPEAVRDFCRRFALDSLPLSPSYLADRSQEVGMVEVMIPPTSSLIGKTVLGAAFRSQYDLAVVGFRRGTAVQGSAAMLEEPLKLGDTLLLTGPWKAIRRLRTAQKELIVLNLPAEVDELIPAAGRARYALLALAVVVLLMVSGVVANVLAALIGCLLLGLFGCMDVDSAYRSIHWQSIVLIVGMMPFALALQKTGGVELAASALVDVTGEAGPRAVLAAIFVTTAVLGLFISNTATAVLMAPVALGVAETMQASPYPFAMMVALGASAAFMTPVSSPVNTLVIVPGGYTFGDFVRVGVPFAVIVLVASVVLVPWLLPP